MVLYANLTKAMQGYIIILLLDANLRSVGLDGEVGNVAIQRLVRD